MNFKNTFLLTGAGFTANFGGFLSRDMWAKIYSNPKLSVAGTIKYKFKEKENFDFEEIYSDVLDERNRIPEGEIKILQDVISETYMLMEKILDAKWDSVKVDDTKLRTFLTKFIEGSDGKAGACFTLNQDLLLEKRFGWKPLVPPSINYNGDFGGILDANDLNSSYTKQLPTPEQLEEYKPNAISNDRRYINCMVH